MLTLIIGMLGVAAFTWAIAENSQRCYWQTEADRLNTAYWQLRLRSEQRSREAIDRLTKSLDDDDHDHAPAAP